MRSLLQSRVGQRLSIVAVLSCLQMASFCKRRSDIDSGDEQTAKRSPPEKIENPGGTAMPSADSKWQQGTPQMLIGEWAAALFTDQRCTGFYSFHNNGTGDLNILCINREKKQIEREHHSFDLSEYPGLQQLKLTLTQSSCPDTDSKKLKGERVYLFASDISGGGQDSQLIALWEPDAKKLPLNLIKADQNLVEGFPAKTGEYLGLPIVSGCFMNGAIAQFQANPS